MTAAEILSELRAAGVAVRVDGDALLCRPRAAVPAVLVPEIITRKPEILALLAAPAPTSCPSCGRMDYLPLPAWWRRCWRCGHRWGPAGAADPGDPSDLPRTAVLLALDGRRRRAPRR